MSGLWLRPVRVGDEQAVRAAHRSLDETDAYTFLLFYDEGTVWPEYVAKLHASARGLDIAPGLVADTFLLAVVDGLVVGRASIRHELNDFLAHEGGHIGYAVLADFRGRGYATEILRQSLVVAASLGVTTAMLACDDSNHASATVIERCGGVYRDQVVARDGSPTRRYDIALVA